MDGEVSHVSLSRADRDAASSDAFLVASRRALTRSYRLAGLILGDAGEAEDAVRDALLAGWRAFGGLRDPARFDQWFHRILVNECRDRLRHRRQLRVVPLDDAGDPAGGDPFALAHRSDGLLRSVSALPQDERVIVLLHYWADVPLDGVAERLALPAGTVRSRLHRALGRLRSTAGVLEGDA
jgi:RNA polymerase sigma-70 factor (ECF subfamily)